MLTIRSILFSIYFTIITFCIAFALPFVAFDFFVFKSRKTADKLGKVWSLAVLTGLKYICQINYKIKGLNNIPKNTPFIIASKHQSILETIIIYKTFREPVFILKKELLFLPLYGWALAMTNQISINRKETRKAFKKITETAKYYFEKNSQTMIIFPQGTRTPIHSTTEKYPYKAGVIGLAKSLECPILPTAINTGLFWGKRQFIKNPGTVIIEFLKPITTKELRKKNKKQLIQQLELEIENKSNELIK